MMRFITTILVGLVGTALNSLAAAQATNLAVDDFQKAVGQSNIQVLDVRTPGEYQSGHLKSAMLADWTNEAEFQERAAALDKNKPVYTYCLSGGRSGAATEWLNKNGYTAYNLSGGVNAWKQAGKPLEQAAEVKQITMQEYLARIPANKTVLVDFSADWCPPCKKMAPVIDSLKNTDGSRFVLVKIDGGEQTSIAKELGVAGLPTYLVYKNGKAVWRKQGVVAAKEFSAQF